jgi:hypothetical protein
MQNSHRAGNHINTEGLEGASAAELIIAKVSAEFIS